MSGKIRIILVIIGITVLLYFSGTAFAIKLKLNQETFANLNYLIKARYEVLNPGSGGDKRCVFTVPDVRLAIQGQIKKNVDFYGHISAGISLKENGTIERRPFNLAEGGGNFKFSPEFQIRIGRIRVPFQRENMENYYSAIVPTNLAPDVKEGVVFHGRFNGNFYVKYNLGIFNNQDDNYRSPFFTFRMSFTPVKMGYNPEPNEEKDTAKGWLKDTYLGKEGNILTLGTGIAFIPKPGDDVLGLNGDFFLEKEINTMLVDFETGLSYFTDTENYAVYYFQIQFLKTEKLGYGNPGIFLKLKKDESSAGYLYWGCGINYYINGLKTRVSLGFDHKNPEKGKTINEIYVHTQFIF